jgi:hypothetical protein
MCTSLDTAAVRPKSLRELSTSSTQGYLLNDVLISMFSTVSFNNDTAQTHLLERIIRERVMCTSLDTAAVRPKSLRELSTSSTYVPFRTTSFKYLLNDVLISMFSTVSFNNDTAQTHLLERIIRDRNESRRSCTSNRCRLACSTAHRSTQ